VPDDELPDDEMEAESRATDRLTLFSDAVVAIAITLLAIDLPVPEGGTVPLFWESVRHNGGPYAAFLISFFAISAAWRDHQRLDPVDRRPAGGVTVASCPPPQAEPRGRPGAGRLSARVIQPPVATGREGSVIQLDQEPT
jgi:Endosomal/lysosomal potassium channel TMEM175